MLQTIIASEVILDFCYEETITSFCWMSEKQVTETQMDSSKCVLKQGTPTRYNLNHIVKVVPEEHNYENWGKPLRLYCHYFSNGEEILFDKDLLDINTSLE